VSEKLVLGKVVVRKSFPGSGIFEGRIAGLDSENGRLHIVFEDGDEEDLSLRQVSKVCCVSCVY